MRVLFVSSEPKVIGFAMYYFTYDPWTGKLLYLEDFFVVEEYRGRRAPAARIIHPVLVHPRQFSCIWERFVDFFLNVLFPLR